jgi:hypothetical protein
MTHTQSARAGGPTPPDTGRDHRVCLPDYLGLKSGEYDLTLWRLFRHVPLSDKQATTLPAGAVEGTSR